MLFNPLYLAYFIRLSWCVPILVQVCSPSRGVGHRQSIVFSQYHYHYRSLQYREGCIAPSTKTTIPTVPPRATSSVRSRQYLSFEVLVLPHTAIFRFYKIDCDKLDTSSIPASPMPNVSYGTFSGRSPICGKSTTGTSSATTRSDHTNSARTFVMRNNMRIGEGRRLRACRH